MIKIIGNRKAEEEIERYLSSSFLSNTFLIYGPQESGKTFFGQYFAFRILGEKVFRNIHPDFFYFKGTGHEYISSIESFLNCANKKPFEASSIVLFFDDLDFVPEQGLNKILKTIEEPPDKTTIIISSKSLNSLLETIVSRSFKIKLVNHLEEEKFLILKEKGIVNASERLHISSSIKVCLSPYFLDIKQKVLEYRSLFKEFVFSKDKQVFMPKVLEFVDKREDCITEFFESLLPIVSEDEVELKKLIYFSIQSSISSVNKYVVFLNFIYSVRNGFESFKEGFK